MGGRGASSGGGGYLSESELASQLAAETNPSRQTTLANELVSRAEGRLPKEVQQDAMTHPEKMVSSSVGGVTVQFPKNLASAAASIATIAATLPEIPKAVSQFTKSVTLTDMSIPGDPSAQSSAGDGDGNITAYNGTELTNVGLLHEATHNFVDGYYTGYNELKATSFADAVDSDEPTPYPQGNGNLEEDFAESTALYLNNKDAFAAQYPQRAAAVKEILDRAAAEGGDT